MALQGTSGELNVPSPRLRRTKGHLALENSPAGTPAKMPPIVDAETPSDADLGTQANPASSAADPGKQATPASSAADPGTQANPVSPLVPEAAAKKQCGISPEAASLLQAPGDGDDCRSESELSEHVPAEQLDKTALQTAQLIKNRKEKNKKEKQAALEKTLAAALKTSSAGQQPVRKRVNGKSPKESLTQASSKKLAK